MRFVTRSAFDKQMRKLPKELRNRVWERLALFDTAPLNPVLRDHKLSAPFEDCRSVNVTGDYRLVYKKLDADTIELRAIGTHHQLYGN
jgi:addiction module RelE/StbE family toxin